MNYQKLFTMSGSKYDPLLIIIENLYGWIFHNVSRITKARKVVCICVTIDDICCKEITISYTMAVSIVSKG